MKLRFGRFKKLDGENQNIQSDLNKSKDEIKTLKVKQEAMNKADEWSKDHRN